MNLNFVTPEDSKVSEDLLYDCIRIGPDQNHPIITVDNVLVDPQRFIKKFIEGTAVPFNDGQNPEEVFPGWQVHLGTKFQDLSILVTYFVNKFSDFKECNPYHMDFSYQLNVMYSDVKYKRLQIQPHVDPAMFAFVLYLNPDEECQGGTSFYNHKHCGIANMEHVDKKFKRTEQYWNYKEWQYDFYNEKKDDEVDLDTGLIEDVYEEEYHVKMKHNRLVIYPSYLWHSAVIAPGMFKDNPRVSLSGFIKSDYFI